MVEKNQIKLNFFLHITFFIALWERQFFYPQDKPLFKRIKIIEYIIVLSNLHYPKKLNMLFAIGAEWQKYLQFWGPL